MCGLWNLQAKIETANAILCWSSWRDQQTCQSEGSSFWSEGCYDGKHWEGKFLYTTEIIQGYLTQFLPPFNRYIIIITIIIIINLIEILIRFLIEEKRSRCWWIRLTIFAHRFHFLLYFCDLNICLMSIIWYFLFSFLFIFFGNI